MAKQTFLYQEHIRLGAKMVDFAGWTMPVQYMPIVDEHNTVRHNIGIFDVSHMGEFIVKGKDSLPFLNQFVPQDLSNLAEGKAVYCQLTNDNGGIIDDLIIYKLKENEYLIIVNASRTDDDYDWISKHKSDYDVTLKNVSDKYSLLAIQGPKTIDLMRDLGIKELPRYFSIKKDVLFNDEVLISRTGYTGEDGVEILVKNGRVVLFWNKILEKGAKYGIKPIGLGARDTLRLEAALPLYGNELTENTTPIEAGLKWSVCKNKTVDYFGKNVIMNQIDNGVEKRLIGLKMLDRGIARHGYEVCYNDKEIGVVTSGGISPIRGDNIAMAYIDNIKDIKPESKIMVKIRGKLLNAEVVKLPFVKKKSKC